MNHLLKDKSFKAEGRVEKISKTVQAKTAIKILLYFFQSLTRLPKYGGKILTSGGFN
jgi:hypothetical protein